MSAIFDPGKAARKARKRAKRADEKIKRRERKIDRKTQAILAEQRDSLLTGRAGSTQTSILGG